MKPKILVADDFPDTLDLLVLALRRNYEVQVASDGLSAWQKWLENFEAGAPFDLCILDVAMPDMTGIEVLTKIKSQRPDCPVLLFTADASVETKCLGAYAGASGVLHKPISLPDLFAAIEKCLG